MHGNAKGPPGLDPVLDEEVGVLEVADDAEVDGERYPQPPFLARLARRFFNADADEDVDYCGEGDQPEEGPVPPAVEHLRRNEQQHVLCLEVALGAKPIQPQDNRQKQQKLRAVEEHARFRLLKNHYSLLNCLDLKYHIKFIIHVLKLDKDRILNPALVHKIGNFLGVFLIASDNSRLVQWYSI